MRFESSNTPHERLSEVVPLADPASVTEGFTGAYENGDTELVTPSTGSALDHVPMAYVHDRPSAPEEPGETPERSGPLTVDDLHADYEQFSDGVNELLHEGFYSPLGSGAYKKVYRLPGFGGLVVKVYDRTIYGYQDQFEAEERAALAMQGLDRFEQVRASSPAEFVTVNEEVEGVTTEKVSARLLRSLTVEKMEEAVAQLAVATEERYVWLDDAYGNMMISETGLHFLDPRASRYRLGEPLMQANLKTVGLQLAGAGIDHDNGIPRFIRKEAIEHLGEAVRRVGLESDYINYKLYNIKQEIGYGLHE